MKKKSSAGILMYRSHEGGLEVFLVHPGGPFWERKDNGSWSIPKGEFEPEESSLVAAKREFQEETGMTVAGEFLELQPLKQPSGKIVHAWAVEGDIDSTNLRSNTFTMEWPPHSGTQREFPEVDKGSWFRCDIARDKMLLGQRGFIDQLQHKLGVFCATNQSEVKSSDDMQGKLF